jgi:hypothetical protein
MKKDFIVYLLSFIIVCFLAFMLCQKCSKIEQKPVIKEYFVRDSIKVTDTIINNIVQERIKIKTKLDTLNKIIYVPRTVIIKDPVLCDSLYSLAIIQKQMISNDSLLIGKLNVNIKNYKKLDTLQQTKIDSLIKVPKNRLKWFAYGFGAGVLFGTFVK